MNEPDIRPDGGQGANVNAREARLAEAFVTLADSLVDDYDVLDLLHVLAVRCVDLLGAGEAGIMLADQRGGLRIAASSSETARLLELFELQVDEGPCVECFATGLPSINNDLTADQDRWPQFTQRARAEGFQGVSALPLRLRGNVIGALNLFHSTPVGLDPAGAQIGQALADVATIGILQERAIRRGEVLTEQLQAALNSRIVIEQAKGMIAENTSITMDAAFAALRGYASGHRRRLSEVAAAVVDRTLDLDSVSVRQD